MNRGQVISIIFYFLLQPVLSGQPEAYVVTKTSFSSANYDEFCPVFYGDGLVFSSNQSASPITSYSSTGNKGVLNIYYTEAGDKLSWENPKLFSKNLWTRFNDGPVTFSTTMDTIYFSRNLNVEGKLRNNSNVRNKLGIFYASKDDDDWTNIRGLRVNNEWFNITTPYLSPDGKRLYFASDDPDGFGGMDLYYMPWMGNYWGEPVNLGPTINTEGNEAYPFINQGGELLFASDGHGGLGGKDIFYTRQSGDNWIVPVHVDAPINSEYDDFGFISDPLINEGYFSSDRDGTVDIYYFKTLLPQIFYSNTQKENQYCFTLSDTGSVMFDTVSLQYLWTIGDSDPIPGAVVKYCFDGPGDYDVILDIVEKSTGRIVCPKLKYIIKLRDIEQPYINAPEVCVAGETIYFDARKSFLPGFEIIDYSWDFGDGTRAVGLDTSHVYSQSGEYNVNLGLGIRSETTGELIRTGISKTIRVFASESLKNQFAGRSDSIKISYQDINNYYGAEKNEIYSVERDLRSGAVFRVELLSSLDSLATDNMIFRNVPSKYALEEKFNEETGLYSYYIEWQMNLMDAYPAYRELLGLGFDEAVIKTVVINDPAEKELFSLIKSHGTLSDRFFSGSNILTSQALIMLDRVVSFMKKYPEVRLEVGLHTDSPDTYDANMKLSQARANAIVNYLVNRGVSVKRLVARGYGESKPIAPNYLEKDREKNRRLELRIIHD